jgi:hypothetical protein
MTSWFVMLNFIKHFYSALVETITLFFSFTLTTSCHSWIYDTMSSASITELSSLILSLDIHKRLDCYFNSSHFLVICQYLYCVLTEDYSESLCLFFYCSEEFLWIQNNFFFILINKESHIFIQYNEMFWYMFALWNDQIRAISI